MLASAPVRAMEGVHAGTETMRGAGNRRSGGFVNIDVRARRCLMTDIPKMGFLSENVPHPRLTRIDLITGEM